MTIKYGACVCVLNTSGYKHILKICNIYFLSIARMVSRTRRLYVKLPVLLHTTILWGMFYVLFVCKCVLYYCHRVLTQLQLTNISYVVSLSIPRKYSGVHTCTRDSHCVVTLLGYCWVWSRIPKLNSWSSHEWEGAGGTRGGGLMICRPEHQVTGRATMLFGCVQFAVQDIRRNPVVLKILSGFHLKRICLIFKKNLAILGFSFHQYRKNMLRWNYWQQQTRRIIPPRTLARVQSLRSSARSLIHTQ